MNLPLWRELTVAVLLGLGAVFVLLAAVGLVRWPDFARRVHAPALAGTAGVGCMLGASALAFGSAAEGLLLLCLIATAPLAAQALITAALPPDDEP